MQKMVNPKSYSEYGL